MNTYLEVVNKVLRRLREPEVMSVSENAYSLLVAEFVNDAKRIVEDSWQWTVLRDHFDVTTVAGTSVYPWYNKVAAFGLTVNERARIFKDPYTGVEQIKIVTLDKEMYVDLVSYEEISLCLTKDANTGTRNIPSKVALEGYPSATEGQPPYSSVIYPIPDGVYIVRHQIVNAQNDLVNDNDPMYVPTAPVVQLAYLFMLYERGEELGEVLTLTSEKADKALIDAIAFDQSNSGSVYRWFIE